MSGTLENLNKNSFLIKKQLFKESTGHRHRRANKENAKEGCSQTGENLFAEIIPSKQQKIFREIISQGGQGGISPKGQLMGKEPNQRLRNVFFDSITEDKNRIVIMKKKKPKNCIFDGTIREIEKLNLLKRTINDQMKQISIIKNSTMS